jgi:hypothetical protein
MVLDPVRKAKADAVMAAVASGMSLRSASKETGVPVQTFLDWCTADPDLAGQYARARDTMIDAMVDETMRLADEPPSTNPITGAIDSASVAKQRLQVDTRKWLLSKLAPKKYGDRLEVAGDPTAPLKADLTVTFVKPGA